ncbi:MAG: Response regulator [Parcubacteria group bacterium GW2011_GWB1_35_5]|nr:MAG: Response regulator [Parcubacteria group bacterium GW2011_GWC1_34_10]KKP80807.1 MAG: Response regulator [Parcubacteria group bacterium GW2011_GWB1_35_5]
MYNNIMSEEIKYKIILVDDDDFLATMYATKFNNSGIATEICSSGVSLLEKLKAGEKPDLILLDIVMPDMSGIEVLEKMHTDKLGEGIPVVMLTNQSDEKDISSAKRFDVAGYIVKASATPSEVVEQIVNIIKNSKN